MQLNEALEKITASDYKLTAPRRILLKAIFRLKKPFSANDLREHLEKSKEATKVDLVTIYRNLSVFEELKLISRCDFSDDEAKYEAAHGSHAHHHHHIICNSCKRVDALEFCILDGQAKLLQKMGYTNLNHRLEFSGTCPKCAASEK